MSFIRYSRLFGWVDWSSDRFAVDGGRLLSTNMSIDFHQHPLTPQLLDQNVNVLTIHYTSGKAGTT
jgi:hypothetical protein